MRNPFLIGEKCYLRPLEEADAELLVVWLNDPEVTRTLTLHRPVSQAAESDFLAQVARSQNDVVLGICGRDEKLVGVTGLHDLDFRSRRASFGIFIGDKSRWGQGIGSEATRLITGYGFRQLNLHRIWLHVNADNERGIRAYERAGYRREGVLKQHQWRDGAYVDVVAMAVTAEEFGRSP